MAAVECSDFKEKTAKAKVTFNGNNAGKQAVVYFIHVQVSIIKRFPDYLSLQISVFFQN